MGIAVFSQITKQHLEEVDAFVVVYSVTDKESVEFAEETLSQLRLLCGYSKGRRRSSSCSPSNLYNRPITKAIILAANKADLARRRRISTEGKKSMYFRWHPICCTARDTAQELH